MDKQTHTNGDNEKIGLAEIKKSSITRLAHSAFIEKNEEALLKVHHLLYKLNMAHLSVAWEKPAINISHPIFAGAKYQLEQAWENAENLKYIPFLNDLPSVSEFPSWVKQYVKEVSANHLHPLFSFLKNEASFEQLREFFFQETPLEMLFGDILAFMLPGVYGSIKVEFLKNYWDEVGKAQEAKVHRNLRSNLMRYLQIPVDSHIQHADLLVREELELINMYLSLATNRFKHTELIGVMLATELAVSGQFSYQIAGWKRFGLNDTLLSYLIEHTSIDEIHAEDWLMQVVMPILNRNPEAMKAIILGITRRLNSAKAVLDRLDSKVRQTTVACIGKFKEN